MRTQISSFIYRGAAVAAAFGLLSLAGCSRRANGDPPRAGGPRNGPIAVDVVVAREGRLRPEPEYTGTTRPTREVALRARTEGRLLNLAVDVGDGVRQGQVLGRLDDALLRQAVQQAESELLSRQSEVAAARSRVGDAQTQVRQAELDLTQKRADFRRNLQLYVEGYVARRDAQQAKTNERVAGQVLRSEQQQVKNLRAEVRAVEARVRAQRAVVAQERERLSYANLASPISGFVTARLTEAGNLISPGGEVLRIGDFRIVQVDVQVSELEMETRVGETVRVTLDALPGREFAGRVDRISPQADPVSRLIPVSITLANPDLKIGAGLLARVRFGSSGPQRMVIPETALQRPGGRGDRGGAPSGGAVAPGAAEPRAASPGSDAAVTLETVFVLDRAAGTANAPADTPQLQPAPASPGGGPAAPGGPPAEGARPQTFTVRAREIQVGAKADGLAEVVSGLEPGDRVVARSARPLKGGEEVVLSVLSQEALREDAGGRETGRDDRGGDPRPPAGGLPRGSGPQGQGDAGRPSGTGSPSRSVAPGGGSFGGSSGGGDRPVTPSSPGTSPSTGRRSGGEITSGGGRSQFGTGGSGSTGRSGAGFSPSQGGQSRSFGGSGNGFGRGTGRGSGTGGGF